ncbi:MAG: AraC family transcriptional regulator, partial [Pseudomonadales bacterium]|nr:AraC family transcriptional regulator [Pseudomonadales bacterium]
MNTNIHHSDIHAEPVTIPGQYLSVLSECVDDFGIKQEHWLSGIKDKSFIATCATKDINFELFQALALRAASLSNNPALGFSVGQRMSLTSHGVLGYALMHCSNLLDAATFIEKYISIRIPLIRCRALYQGDEFILLFEENTSIQNDMRTLLIDALLLTVKKSLDQLMPSLQYKTTICFPSLAHKNFPYQSLFDCATEFDSKIASIRISNHSML